MTQKRLAGLINAASPTTFSRPQRLPPLSAGVDSKDLAKRGESLIRQSSNRYLTRVRIAFRAKQRRFDAVDGLLEESSVKPVQRAIVELSAEQDQPDLLPG